MMGRLKSEQGQLFYQFNLEDAVPDDHLVRRIDAALDLSWLRNELSPHYSSMGRPSIDPDLMIRMLVVRYVFAIRSERLICREVQVNLACRWFCKLGIEDAITKQPNKDMRRHRAILVSCMRTVGVLPKTILKLSHGSAKQPTKDMRRHSTILASCMQTVAVSPKMTPKRSVGFTKLPTRDLHRHKPVFMRLEESNIWLITTRKEINHVTSNHHFACCIRYHWHRVRCDYFN